MKQKKTFSPVKTLLCLALAAVLLLAGTCVPAFGESGEGRYTFNPHLYVSLIAQDVPQEYWDAFHSLCDALRAGEAEFACSSEEAYRWAMDVSTWAELFPAACTKIKQAERNEPVPWKNGTGRIVYRMPADEFAAREAAFEAKVEEVLNTVLELDDSAFEKCLKLYHYICEHYTYNYDFQETMPDGANYLAILEGKGQCVQLGSVYAYFLLQAGVEAMQVGCTNPQIAHAWTYFVIDGKGYHSDPTWALYSPEDGQELCLYYFLMSDSRRENSGCAVDDLTSPLLPRYWSKLSASKFIAGEDGLAFPAVSFFLRLDEADRTVIYSVEGEEQSLRYAGE